jgi:predicted secreted protein
MGVTSAIVLYLVIWFMTFLIALPIRVKTQGDLGEIVHGTHAGAPEHHHLRAKFKIVTVVSAVIWAILAYIIISGTITVRDIDFFGRMGPPSDVSATE